MPLRSTLERSGATAGHIPGSVNVPYTDVFDPSNQLLKPLDELRQRNEKRVFPHRNRAKRILSFSFYKIRNRFVERNDLHVSNGNNGEHVGLHRSSARSKIGSGVQREFSSPRLRTSDRIVSRTSFLGKRIVDVQKKTWWHFCLKTQGLFDENVPVKLSSIVLKQILLVRFL